MKNIFSLLVCSGLGICAAQAETKTDYPLIENAFRKDIFEPGQAGSKFYRIPAIVTAMNGDLVAVIDARRKSTADMQHVRDIDIAIRRSSDNGNTWTETEFVTDFPDGQVGSDPALIVDKQTGEIFCFYNYLDHDLEINKTRPSRTAVNYRHYVQSSKDHGKTWSKPKDIRDDIMPKGVKERDFVFITSGSGVQTSSGALIHTICHVGKGGYLFGSNDHGKTWKALETASYAPANENKFLELSDGRWMINARSNGNKARYIHVSKDKGKSWESYKDTNLPDPGCNAEPIIYTLKMDGYAKNRLLFVNSHSTKGRKNLVLSLSYDDGKTWTHKKCLEKGAAGYSTITICKNGDIGIFFENGKKMKFVRVTLKDLTDGKDQLQKPFALASSKSLR
jgi:sialidase-1